MWTGSHPPLRRHRRVVRGKQTCWRRSNGRWTRSRRRVPETDRNTRSNPMARVGDLSAGEYDRARKAGPSHGSEQASQLMWSRIAFLASVAKCTIFWRSIRRQSRLYLSVNVYEMLRADKDPP